MAWRKSFQFSTTFSKVKLNKWNCHCHFQGHWGCPKEVDASQIGNLFLTNQFLPLIIIPSQIFQMFGIKSLLAKYLHMYHQDICKVEWVKMSEWTLYWGCVIVANESILCLFVFNWAGLKPRRSPNKGVRPRPFSC